MTATVERRPFFLDMDIKSLTTDDEGGLHMRGYAAAFSTDRDKEVIQRGAAESAVERYMANPVLLLNHDITKPIGKILSATVDDFGILVDAFVPRPVQDWAVEAYEKIRDGIYRAFSVGGLFGYQGKSVVQMDWAETSVVAVPAHPHALFEVVRKSFDLRNVDTARDFFAAMDTKQAVSDLEALGVEAAAESVASGELTAEDLDLVMQRVKMLQLKAQTFVEATERQGIGVQTAKAIHLQKKAKSMAQVAERLGETLQRMRQQKAAPPVVPTVAVAAPRAVASSSPLKSKLGHAHADIYNKPCPRSVDGKIQVMGEPPGAYVKAGSTIGFDNGLRAAAVSAGYTSDVANKIAKKTKERIGDSPRILSHEHIAQQRAAGSV